MPPVAPFSCLIGGGSSACPSTPALLSRIGLFNILGRIGSLDHRFAVSIVLISRIGFSWWAPARGPGWRRRWTPRTRPVPRAALAGRAGSTAAAPADGVRGWAGRTHGSSSSALAAAVVGGGQCGSMGMRGVRGAGADCGAHALEWECERGACSGGVVRPRCRERCMLLRWTSAAVVRCSRRSKTFNLLNLDRRCHMSHEAVSSHGLIARVRITAAPRRTRRWER